jgi:hypothetical protein
MDKSESKTVGLGIGSALIDWITSSTPLDRVDLAKVIEQGSEAPGYVSSSVWSDARPDQGVRRLWYTPCLP